MFKKKIFSAVGAIVMVAMVSAAFMPVLTAMAVTNTRSEDLIFQKDSTGNVVAILSKNGLITPIGDVLVIYNASGVATGIKTIYGEVIAISGTGTTYTLPVATSSVLGGIKPDGTTIIVNSSGVASASGTDSTYTLPTASSSVLGGIKVDGTTITVNGSGVASAGSTVAAAGTLTGTTLASNVTASSLLSAAGGSFGNLAYVAPDGVTIVVNSGVASTTATPVSGVPSIADQARVLTTSPLTLEWFTPSAGYPAWIDSVNASAAAAAASVPNTAGALVMTTSSNKIPTVVLEGIGYSLQQSALTMSIASSGVVDANGVFTATNTYLITQNTPGQYQYFDANGLADGSLAAHYWSVCSATITCVICQETYDPTTHVAPTAPASCTPYNTSARNYAGHTGGTYVLMAEIAVPANSLGVNGKINWNFTGRNYSSGNNKLYKMFFGGATGTVGSGTQLFSVTSTTGTNATSGLTTTANKGHIGYQTNLLVTAGAPVQTSYDTSAVQYLQLQVTNVVTGDWVSIVDYWIDITPRN